MIIHLSDYQLILLDFDGLLVNTEQLHFTAYQQVLATEGISFNWSFERYCQAAHYHPFALRDQLYIEYPILHTQVPNWNHLYLNKKQAILELVKEGLVQLMPGVESFLYTIQAQKIKHCVVTHSPLKLIETIRQQHTILQNIPYWITREDYEHPKPHAESYLKAIEKYALEQDKVIGFEDTPRGIWSLLGTKAQPVLICQTAYPEIPTLIQSGVRHFPSFLSLQTL